jgi:hypothetical protein
MVLAIAAWCAAHASNAHRFIGFERPTGCDVETGLSVDFGSLSRIVRAPLGLKWVWCARSNPIFAHRENHIRGRLGVVPETPRRPVAAIAVARVDPYSLANEPRAESPHDESTTHHYLRWCAFDVPEAHQTSDL